MRAEPGFKARSLGPCGKLKLNYKDDLRTSWLFGDMLYKFLQSSNCAQTFIF